MTAIADSKHTEQVNESLGRFLYDPETKAARARERSPLLDVWLLERSALLGLCLRWTRGNLSEAEDLLADACLRVIEGSQCDGVVFAGAFVFWATVINNLARDRFRRARRWKFESGSIGSELIGSLPADVMNAEQIVLLRERLAAVERQITYLTEKQRSALLLRSRGLDYSGIGETLRTSAVNARKLVETARRSLNEGPRARAAFRPPLSTLASGSRHHILGY